MNRNLSQCFVHGSNTKGGDGVTSVGVKIIYRISTPDRERDLQSIDDLVVY